MAGCADDPGPAGPRDASLPDAGVADAGPIAVARLPDGGADCALWGPSALPSSFMATGHPCLECHDRPAGAADAMTVAGTVFHRLRAHDDCQGESDVAVVVTGAEGDELRLQSNFAGNFYSTRALAFPIRARLETGGRVRRMADRVETGDCNGCHTQDGVEDAPGRIVTPAAP